jgi:hypothetical protein
MLAFSIVGAVTLNAQNVNNEIDKEGYFLSSKTVPVFKGYKNTKGSIYNNKEFQRGSVFLDGKLIASNVGLRYNAQNEEMEYKKQLSSQATVVNVIQKNVNIEVQILSDRYVYCVSPSEKLRDGYFIVLEENDRLILYKKLSKEFVGGKKSDTFKEREALYIKIQGEKLQEVPGSKGKIKKLFSANQDEMSTFIKKNKINLRNDEDLLKFLKYYSTLK